MPQDKENRPKRDVTRAEFRDCAERAGWYPKVISLFLDVRNPVHDYFGCGEERLRIIDWPA